LLGAVAGTSVWIQYVVGGGAVAWTPTLAAVAYYTIAGYAGLQLLRRSDSADRWALAAVIPQIVQLQFAHFIYKIACGLQLSLAFDGFSFALSAGVASVVQVGGVGPELRPTIAVNLLAATFAWYLYTRRSGAA
jgi:hypothetical protein